MTQMWTPVVGEKYRLRVRGEDMPCPKCGYVQSEETENPRDPTLPSIRDVNGSSVMVLEGEGRRPVYCGKCDQRLPSNGFVDITFRVNGDPVWVTVPYTWLEPLDAPQRTGRVF